MKYLVMDVAASTGGALSILQQFYERALEDKENKWIFVVSTPDFLDAKNVEIVKYPWIKKNWVNRLIFELFIAKSVVNKFEPNQVYNLQNIVTLGIKCRQVVYLHQAIPFSAYKMKLLKEPLLWFYQNIYSHVIFYSLKKADQIIVQTNFMKEDCLRLLHIPEEKIVVVRPSFKTQKPKIVKPIDLEDKTILFYPAGGPSFKNHEVIIDALLLMDIEKLEKMQIVFTLIGNESKVIKKLRKEIQKNKLPVTFVGYLDKEKMIDYYSRSILIFPSVIETFGLPLLEAKQFERKIIASDTPFSHEILDDYEKVEFFDAFSPQELSRLLNLLN